MSTTEYNRQYQRQRRAKVPEYAVWVNMIQRCTNPNHPRYEDYGGRGVEVCEQWQGEGGFETFLTDVGRRPPNPPGWSKRRSYHSLDRIDNLGDYEPGNVRWASTHTQRVNRRTWEERYPDIASSL